MNFTGFRDIVKNRCGASFADPAAQNSAVGEIVNQALQAVDAEQSDGWPWTLREVTFTTVQGQEAYDLETIAGGPVRKATWVRIMDPPTMRSDLPRVTRAQQLDYFDSVTQEPPLSFSIRGGQLYLLPIPSDAFDCLVEVVLAEPALVADLDEPLLPERYDGAVTEKAAEILFRRLHNPSEATVARGEYGDWIKRMRRSAAKEYRGPGRVNYDLSKLG